MIGIVIMTILAFVLGLIIVLFSSYLDNEERLEQDYKDLLPGYNCGSCGYGSCTGMAKAMLDDPNNYKKCQPLRGDALKEMETYLRMKSEKS